MKRLYLVAGESSGDLHGGSLVRALKARAPQLEFFGTGGDKMEALGVQLTRHIRDTDFMGFAEVLKNLGKIRRLFKDVKRDILACKPDAVILIDYPGFNLRLLPFLKKNDIPALFYISPQVWAWKKSRVKKIKKYVDRLFVILPFEKDFYAKEGVEVEYVGHPLLDEIAAREVDKPALRKEFGLDERPVVALLPGSRKQEIRRKLPVMLAAARHFPDCQFLLAGAPLQPEAFYREQTGDSGVKLVMNRTYDVLSIADYALVTSGTATLETALFGVPEVVCYAADWASVKLARLLIKVKYISLVNLIMDREVVKELIQEDLTVENVVLELRKFVENPNHLGRVKADYAALWEKLGAAGASDRAAEAMLTFLSGKTQ